MDELDMQTFIQFDILFFPNLTHTLFCFTEARYHYLVERIALREGSEAWERVKKDDIGIPKEMVAWVNNELELSDAKKTSDKVEAVKA